MSKVQILEQQRINLNVLIKEVLDLSYLLESKKNEFINISVPDTTKHSPIDLASIALTDYVLSHNESGKKTTSYPCVIKADPSILEIVHKINAAKGKLKDLYSSLDDTIPSNFGLIYDFEKDTLKIVSKHMIKKEKKMRLNMFHIFRKIYVFDEPIKSIGFSHSDQSRLLVKTTKQAVLERLYKMDTAEPLIQGYINTMRNLDNEVPLVIAAQQKSHIRANVRLINGGLKTFKANMPIFVSNLNPNIELLLNNNKRKKNIEPRSDKITSDLAIVPMLHVYTQIIKK